MLLGEDLGLDEEELKVLSQGALMHDRTAALRSVPEEEGATVGRTGGDVAWQLDHLSRYEREAVRPRIEGWTATAELEFADWEDDSRPGPDDETADLEARVKEFEAERAKTLAVLRGAGPDLLGARGRLGDEGFSAYQFLRAVAQHDDAHRARIGERLHRSLLEEE